MNVCARILPQEAVSFAIIPQAIYRYKGMGQRLPKIGDDMMLTLLRSTYN
jgi:hypothetical protein